MSQLLDKISFFTRPKEAFSDGHGTKTTESREWEKGYRAR